MAIQWMAPILSLEAALWGGEAINESASAGLEWVTPAGTAVNEAAAAGSSFNPGGAYGATKTIGAIY